MRILAFHCHPDDIEFMMGGTMALLAKQGHEIHFATMAGGEVGSPSLRQQEIRALRVKEAEQAAATIGATYRHAGGHDLEVQYDNHCRKLATKVVRDVAPDLILTAPPSDYLIDHEETSKLVRNAAFIASVPNYDCGQATTPTDSVPHLYYCDAAGGRDPFGRALPVHFAVDVSSVMEQKRAMAACHQSQEEWIKFVQGEETFTQIMERGTRECGQRFGVDFAEAFIQHRAMGHPSYDILRELLEPYVLAEQVPS